MEVANVLAMMRIIIVMHVISTVVSGEKLF